MTQNGHDGLTLLRLRARLNRCVRGFFEEAGFVEVETPLLAARLIPEPSIGIFATEQHHADGSARTLYLTPSPELWMKRLVAAGMPRVYQLARCFRNVEEQGAVPSPRVHDVGVVRGGRETTAMRSTRMERLLAALRAEVATGGGARAGGRHRAAGAPGGRWRACGRTPSAVDPAGASGAELAALARRLEIPTESRRTPGSNCSTASF